MTSCFPNCCMYFRIYFMKKIAVLVLVLFVSLSSSLFAQDYYGSNYSGKRVSLGIGFSPNLHWLRYNSGLDVKKKVKVGYTYGLYSDFALTENYYLSTGFLISNLKASSDYQRESLENPPMRTYHLQYIEIPFALKLQSTQRYFRSYYGLFGFSTAVKINGKMEQSGESKTNMGSLAKPFRLALQVGGGVNWQLDHKMTLMTGITLNNGFTALLKEGKPKSSYLALNFGIFF